MVQQDDWLLFCGPSSMHTISITIETPKGSSVKYHYDKKADRYSVKKLLTSGMVFPYDFGFVPGTKGQDGDALDALSIAEFGTFTGCQLEGRLIGCMQAEQQDDRKKIRNDRYLFIPLASHVYGNINSIEQLPSGILEELEHFFVAYNRAEKKHFKITKMLDEKQAYKNLKKEHARFID